ncbi:hypothetical protein, partial [Vibrio anguillarum]|uniref:hypothetical protein n=1 Tax=Vibrio anguillarum TaxID=55601 RepID=UPI001BE4A262
MPPRPILSLRSSFFLSSLLSLRHPPVRNQALREGLAGCGECDESVSVRLTAPSKFGTNFKLVGRLGAALA